MKKGVDHERRKFIRQTSHVLAAGLILPNSTGALASAIRIGEREATELQRRIEGTVVLRDTTNYEPWRHSMIWNYRKFDRRPELIVQADSPEDVVTTVNFARQNGMRIKTRTGGHSWSGCYLRDSGILLDLSRFQSVEINTTAKQAVVGAGVLGRDLVTRLGEHGLAFPTAHCGMVPLSGYLLGGGLGLNGVAWGGMSTFNIEALDAVTADGELIHINAQENPELFWAARGGGPGLFFVVTRFYLRCYSLPKAITVDTYILPYEELIPTVEMMDRIGPGMNPSVEMLGAVIPADDECSADRCERVVLLNATAFVDTQAEAKEMLAPIRAEKVARRAIDTILDRPATFEMLYQENEGPFPQSRASADNIFTERAVEAAEVVERHMRLAPSPSDTPVILYRGALEFPDAAYSLTGKFYMSAYAQWGNAADDKANLAWLKDFYDDMQAFAVGHYLNEFSQETRESRLCFSADNWKRLQRLRQQYDPHGVFHYFLGTS